MSLAKVIAQAWTDPAFKEKLVNQPAAALADHGLTVPEGTTVKVIEDTGDTRHIVLPVTPGNAMDNSLEELERIAGGTWPASGYNTCLGSGC